MRARPRWQTAEPPVRPRNPPDVQHVEDAYLTEVSTGRLASIHRPDQWFRGAVYDREDTLVTASQKLLADRRGARAAADPDKVVRRADAPTLEGTWLYGGTWATVFGHFLVETLTTLWPEPDERPAGLVFHSNFGSHTVDDWHRRLIELAGWGDLPIHVVGRHDPVRVERLVVPGRSIALHAWVHPEARRVWERVAHDFRDAGGPRKVYVSRTALNARRRAEGHRRRIRTTAEYDAGLDRVFTDHGFELVRPEDLDIDGQLRTMASAEVIAGLSGSGLHHSAFLPAGGRVVELGDGRTSDRPVHMQVAIDAAMGHERCFVPGTSTVKDVARTLSRLKV